MLKKFLAGLLTAGTLFFPFNADAAGYDTSQLKNPHAQIFYLYEIQVNLDIKEQLQRAHNLIEEEKDYPMAIAVCNQIIELDSNVSVAYLLKGLAYTEMKKFSDADNEYQKALKIEPENPTFHYYRGMNYLYWSKNSSGGYEYDRANSAINIFNKALKFENHYIDAIVGVGDAYTVKALYYKNHHNKRDAVNSYNSAIDQYNKILVWFPKNSTVLAKKSMAQKAIAEIQAEN